MEKIKVVVSEEDFVELFKTIIEVEATTELYDQIVKKMDVTPDAVKAVLVYRMEVLASHKLLWKKILHKYLGVETTAQYERLLRFDTNEKVIFTQEIEGCSLCR